jgi:hypothetical protein
MNDWKGGIIKRKNEKSKKGITGGIERGAKGGMNGARRGAFADAVVFEDNGTFETRMETRHLGKGLRRCKQYDVEVGGLVQKFGFGGDSWI